LRWTRRLEAWKKAEAMLSGQIEEAAGARARFQDAARFATVHGLQKTLLDILDRESAFWVLRLCMSGDCPHRQRIG
jgi:hypothetical protein